ncbi:MAG: efflux RND transporter permease subunit [Hyphomicrobiales bacterium]|nr:efflux RND transporter permease subunit [Hyphomicrobiales bacterium]
MIRFFAGHPTAANLVMIGFLAIGLFSLPLLPRETFPRLEPNRVEVSVIYPGARAEDVKEAICDRIEDAISKVNQVLETKCEAREGIGRAEIKMREGSNLDRFTADIKTQIDAITSFPQNTERPIVKQLGRTDFVAAVAVTGPENRSQLKAYAEDLKARMQQTPGITKVDIRGFSDHQIRIELSDQLLRQYGVTIADVAGKIRRQSRDAPVGILRASDRELLLRVNDERRKAREFKDIVVVAAPGGGEIKLGDIATITDRFELDEDKILFNGKSAAVLEISKDASEDTLEAMDALQKFLTQERAAAPKGIELSITRDVSSIVRDRLRLVGSNMLQGLALVALVLFLFFGLRYSFWVAMGLPVSFAGAFGVMVGLEQSINMLTLIGFLIGIGLLMDDAIVISENIAAHRQKGKSPLDAAVDGTREVMPSVISSFTTTACVFGSLLFLKGDIGQILKVIPAVMLVILAVSLIEAFVVLPNHLKHSIAHAGIGEGRLQKMMERGLSWARDHIAGPAVDWCVAWRYLAVGAAIALFMSAIAMVIGGAVKFRAFPAIEGDTTEARILLPQGTPLARTQAVAEHVVAAMKRIDTRYSPDQPDGKRLVRNITISYNKNVDSFETGAHVATVTVDLLQAEIRKTSMTQVIADWRRETGSIADVVFIKFNEPAAGPAGLAIDLRLAGRDLTELKAASRELTGWLRRYKGVRDLTDDLRPGKPEVRVRLKPGASSLGVDTDMIVTQMRGAYLGTIVNKIQVGPEQYEIDVRIRRTEKDSIDDLRNFTISIGGGRRVPITDVADLDYGRGYARIQRIDGIEAVTIQGDVDTRLGNASAIVSDTQKRFIPGLLKRYPGVRFSVKGQNDEARKTQVSMLRGMIVGLVGVFILLSFQFRSYIEPVVVMAAIPLALVGVVYGHWIMGLELSMPSLLGFVALAGVVVNNSILLVNFAKIRFNDGMPLAEAARQASRARFRAIFLTTTTTIAGLLPILSETSLQAQVLIPLVTSLMFGLVSSTLLVLMVVPSLYLILDDFGLTSISRKDGEDAAPEQSVDGAGGTAISGGAGQGA